jgi:hypothetical protein
MTSSTLRLFADSRWPQPMMAYTGCFVPHVLGRKSGRLHMFCYQFGGGSRSGLPMVPERMGEWRCLAVEKLSEVELRADGWHTEPRSPRQTCIDEIELDADAQPGDKPQQGH